MKKIIWFLGAVCIFPSCASNIDGNVNDKSGTGKVVTLSDEACELMLEIDNPGIGVVLIDYNHESNKTKINDISKGVVVNNIIVGTPADINGLPNGVVITHVNGEVLSGADQLLATLKLFRNKTLDLDYASATGEKGSRKLDVVTFQDYQDNCTFQYKY